MSDNTELKRQIERLGGQMVGVQAAVDALVCATLQTGATNSETLRMLIRSTIEVFPMNPNMLDEEVAGATAFLTSTLQTIDTIEKAAK